MFEVFLEHKLLCGAFLILLLLSIICQIMIGVIYRRMIKETDNMAATDNKFLKQCKLKFINCYQMNAGVANISVFVDKFIANVSFKGISLTGLQHLSGQFMLLSVAVAGVAACFEIIQGETVGRILPYYIAAFIGLYLYFSISGIMDIQGKRERLKTNLVDYLENHMVNKLRRSAVDWEGLTGEKLAAAKERTEGSHKEQQDRQMYEKETKTSDKIKAMREEMGLAPERQNRRGESEKEAEQKNMRKADEETEGFSKREEQELEELLREFFV